MRYFGHHSFYVILNSTFSLFAVRRLVLSMLGKVDLVMWTKNGSTTLPFVLKRISEVIPGEFVSNRIIVDDQSTDSTIDIAKTFGWQVILNQGNGISDGANTALKRVMTKHFISFEQDLLLSRNWWHKIPPLLDNPRVIAASGMRFASKPQGLKELQRYVAKKYRGEASLATWLRSRKMAAFTLGKTLDNTIYKTELLRALGGFPKMPVNAGVDAVLAYKLSQAGYHWIVDYTVQSVHLRTNLKQELRHQYWYGTQLHAIWRRIEAEANRRPPITRFGVIYRFFVSPFTGLFIASKTRDATIAYIHPLIRFYLLKGLLHAYRFESCS